MAHATDTPTNDTRAAGTQTAGAQTAGSQTSGAKIGPLADKARAFAREKPFATAALAGVIGIALLNTLRGKSRT